MNPKTFDRMLLIIAIVLGVVMFSALRIANADDPDLFQSNDMNNQTTGDLKTGGNRSIALVNTLGDVDIGQCRFSTQWGTPLFSKQKIVLDETCVGFQFLALGEYDLAAMHFCNDKDTLAEFASEIDCENEHDFTPPANDGGQSAQFDKHFELAQAQEQEIEYLQEENASIVNRLEALTARIDQTPARAVVKQQPQYTQEQVNAVWAALGIDEDE